MTRITNADQVLTLLRSHLQRAERLQRKDPGKTDKARTKQTPVERVQALAHGEGLPHEEIERALIAGMFTEEFGSAVANDPAFQQTVENALRMIRDDPRSRDLLHKAIGQLVSAKPD